MTREYFLPSLALACAGALGADQIVLRNGDRLTGEIVKKDGAILTFKSAHFGTVSVPWSEIASAGSGKPLNIVLAGGRTVQRVLNESVALADIVALRNDAEQRSHERMLAPGWLDVWAGSATIGWAGTRGNSQTATLSAGFNAARITNGDKTTVYLNGIRASATVDGVSRRTAQAIRGGWAYNRNIHPRVFLNAFNDWEYDRFLGLDLRTVLGGGLGYNVWKAERSRLDLLGGAAWNREKFDPAPSLAFVRNSAEAYWGDDFNYKLSARTNLLQGFRMFHNLTRRGEYRHNADIGATTQLFKWLAWNLSLSNRYLSDPAPGRKRNDFLYTTGFGISFAR